MNNYENQKTDIDLILQSGDNIGVHKDTKKVTTCPKLDCERCLLSYRYNESHYCAVNRIKWLVSEYEEPEVDWTKVPIDTPVLAAMDKAKWYNFYFAGTDDRGNTYVYSYGRTSWSSKTAYDGDTVKVPYIKLAEVADEKSE